MIRNPKPRMGFNNTRFMSTYTQILYHIVFSTKRRERTLPAEKRTELFQYIWGILNNKKCHLYRINGVEDHLHIATHIHPTISVSSLIKDIKLASSTYIKSNGLFKTFNGWQDGYGAFTYSVSEKDQLIDYIKNQEEHHKYYTFREEYIKLLREQGIEFDEKYLF
ncbi:MAG TPA: IS200/IS605 family transposase [Balneolales bacterium]|nr:IS200/IS605 family transposase [Balneolales bacterium]